MPSKPLSMALALSLVAALAVAASLKVRVIDEATGKPVQNATVVVQAPGAAGQPAPAPREFRARRGETTIRDVVPNAHLTVRAPGYVEQQAAVPAAATKDPLEIKLQPALTYRGRVTSPAGDPIPGVSVWHDAGGPTPGVDPATKTDEKGEFTLILPAGNGNRSFRLSKDGLSEERVTAAGTGSERRAEAVLQPTVSLPGVVNDDAGAPLAAARIRAISKVRSGEVRETKSDDQGRFVLEDLRAGTHTIEVTKRGYAPRTVSEVSAPSPTPLGIAVDRGATVTGTVVGATAEETPYLMVYVGTVITGINGEGKFGILGAAPGKARVYAEYASDGLLRRTEPLFLEIRNGVAGEVAIALKDGPVLEGIVREDGKPVQRAVVTVTGGTMAQARVVTDENGSFRIVGLPRGTFTAAVEGRDPEGTTEISIPREEPLDLAVGPIVRKDLPGLPQPSSMPPVPPTARPVDGKY